MLLYDYDQERTTERTRQRVTRNLEVLRRLRGAPIAIVQPPWWGDDAPATVDAGPADTLQTEPNSVTDQRIATGGRCTATRVDGSPCRARTVSGRDVCIGHGDWHRAPRTAGRPRGRRLGPILDQLQQALVGLVEGRIDAREAEVAALLGSLIVDAQRGRGADAALEQRLADLERRLLAASSEG